MTRAQLAIIAQDTNTNGLSTTRMTAVRSGSNDIAFRVEIVDGSQQAYTVADDAGKVRTFRDADDYLKQAGALSMLTDSMEVSFQGLALVAPKPFTGDIVKKNETAVAGYVKRAAAAGERLATLAQAIALMAADPTVPVSLKQEKQAQKDSVDALKTWLDGEVVRINALLGV